MRILHRNSSYTVLILEISAEFWTRDMVVSYQYMGLNEIQFVEWEERGTEEELSCRKI